MTDTRTYQDRAEYQREWQRRYKAAHRHQIAETARAKRERDHFRQERLASKSFADFFNSHDLVSVVGYRSLFDPMYIVIRNGRKYRECLGDPLPEWTDEAGRIHGGLSGWFQPKRPASPESL
jgi:hypothetical protein